MNKMKPRSTLGSRSRGRAGADVWREFFLHFGWAKFVVILATVLLASSPAVSQEPIRPAQLPGDYFKLLKVEVNALQTATTLKTNPGAMLAAGVLYRKEHSANPSFHDKKILKLALALGDLYAGRSEKDMADNKQDYEWEIHFWLDTYRLLESELGAERRTRWRKEIEKIVSWFARETAGRIDFPRYQGPYIRTSTNHLALFASTVYLAGRVLPNKEWETLGARALHRLATEEQTADGYWGEFTDNGPATGYNYLTMCCVALYWEHSRDPGALEALRRATDFHKNFTWPDGTPVETINGRNRHWAVSPWGHFGFSHWPDGRRYAAFLAGFFTGRNVSSRDLGRIAQSTLYYHEGPTAPIPQELPRFVHQMKVPAGIRKTGPWVVCLSGLIDASLATFAARVARNSAWRNGWSLQTLRCYQRHRRQSPHTGPSLHSAVPSATAARPLLPQPQTYAQKQSFSQG
jgi:hypothetical protein